MKVNIKVTENELNNNYPLTKLITQEEKIKKSFKNAETISPSGFHEFDINLNSTSNKLEHEKEHVTNSKDFKKIRSFKICNNKNSKSLSRMDTFGNPIQKKGKQKISFIDKISQNKFIEVIQIESFKAYNKIEEIANYNNMQNNCCFSF